MCIRDSVYAFLPYCDALISDYSSVFVDYLCSGKPIVLFPYDLDAYLKSDAGLYYNFDDVAPGDICFTWEQVLDAIVSKIREETQNSKYCKLMKLFNHYNDGCNCERVYDIVINPVSYTHLLDCIILQYIKYTELINTGN